MGSFVEEVRVEGLDVEKYDVAIVGGGLAGVFAALELSALGRSCTLIDAALPAAAPNLGGFVGFSGAKFSLPPAGQGLVPVAGSHADLDNAIAKALDLLSLTASGRIRSTDSRLNGSLELRDYESIVLTPLQVSDLIKRLDNQVRAKVPVVHGRATRARRVGQKWAISVENEYSRVPEQIFSNAIFFAGGRLANDFAQDCGLVATDAKGLDVGIRLEFSQKESLAGLKSLGPDAKILKGNVRTFCLNYPGEIYYYESGGILIPGGVVAEEGVTSANVGILRRILDKQNVLHSIKERILDQKSAIASLGEKSFPINDEILLPDLAGSILGVDIASELQDFLRDMLADGLIRKIGTYKVHLPLLDWHWPTYAQPSSHRTNVPSIYALGDSSGHARGLLQACLSGLLAAQEFVHAP